MTKKTAKKTAKKTIKKVAKKSKPKVVKVRAHRPKPLIPPKAASNILLRIMGWLPSVCLEKAEYHRRRQMTRLLWDNPLHARRALDRLNYLVPHYDLITGLMERYSRASTHDEVGDFLRALKVNARLMHGRILVDETCVDLEVFADGSMRKVFVDGSIRRIPSAKIRKTDSFPGEIDDC